MSTVVTSVDAGSCAELAGIRPGEQLLKLNGHKIEDVLDYRFFCYDPVVKVEMKKEDGSVYHKTVEKEEGEDLGLNFDTYLMDEPRPCSNHCLFCFVDQMPPDMRETLYFKDDDARLSFLMGNYITLTNLSEREAQRIIDLHISPINVSVHTTDPELRPKLLGNKNANKSLEYMKAFGEAGIEMNGQIVVCPGWNDRAGVETEVNKIGPVDKEKAGEIIDTVDEFAEKCLRERGTRTFFCADELYIKAERELPNEDYYEEYGQLENGVGMLRSMMSEFFTALEDIEYEKVKSFTLVTGVSAAPFLEKLIAAAKEKYPSLQGEVVAIVNDFFGHLIDVSGLVTGGDIIKQLKERDWLGERILIPANMLRHGDGIFLDDVTVDGLSEALQRPVLTVDTDGWALAEAIFS